MGSPHQEAYGRQRSHVGRLQQRQCPEHAVQHERGQGGRPATQSGGTGNTTPPVTAGCLSVTGGASGAACLSLEVRQELPVCH